MEPLLLGILNTPEIIALLVIALILFGSKKLPELAKGLGHGIKEFRKASREISDELNSAISEAPPAPPRRSPSAYSEPTTPEGTQPQEAAADSSSGSGSEAPAVDRPETTTDAAGSEAAPPPSRPA